MSKKASVPFELADSKDIIRELCKMRKWTQADLAYEMGYASQAGVGQILSNKPNARGISMNVYVNALNALGAELIVRDKMGSGKEWRIDDLLLRESIDSGAKSSKAD